MDDSSAGHVFYKDDKLRRDIDLLLNEFKDVFSPADSLPPHETDHRHYIHLEPNSTPYNGPIYNMSPIERQELIRQLKNLIEAKKIRPSSSPWGAPVLFAKKSNGELRFCVDYRKLNAMTVKDSTSTPPLDALFSSLADARIISVADAHSGYHQIPMALASISKTAFKTLFGTYEWLVMPFGLSNAPATFVRMVNEFFMDFLHEWLVVYMDDFLIHSKSPAEHLKHLRAFFLRCREKKLFLKRKKCYFGLSLAKYCGFIVGNGEIRPDPLMVQDFAN
jgi:hypothetical protein